MPAPYIPRLDGDLISAQDWNEIQVRTRADIAAVDAKFMAPDPNADITVRNLKVTGEATLGLSGPKVFEARLTESDAVWSFTYLNNNPQNTSEQKPTRNAHGALGITSWPPYGPDNYYGLSWGHDSTSVYLGSTDPATSQISKHKLNVLMAPKLSIVTTQPTMLLLSCRFGLQPPSGSVSYNGNGFDASRDAQRVYAENYSYYPDIFQFMLGKGDDLVPVRSSGLLKLDTPTARTLPDWIAAHVAFRKKEKYLPMAGHLSYVAPGSITPHHIEETLEVPAGTWLIRLGAVGFSTLYDVFLRAIAIPLGDAK